MSGYKRATISITQDEYDRLHDAQYCLREVPDVPAALADTIRAQSTQALQGCRKELEQRHAAFQQVLGSLDDSIRLHEAATAGALLASQASALRQAERSAGELWEHVSQALGGQAESVAAALRASQQQGQSAQHTCASALWQAGEDSACTQAAAGEWLATIQALYAFIERQYACEFFLPGALAALARGIHLAQAHLQDSLPEAAILTAQQVYCQLSDLRLDLEQRQSRWQLLLLACWETASQILAVVMESQQVQAHDLDGSPLPYAVVVDTWTQGRLGDLAAGLSAVLDALSAPEPALTSETLQSWRDALLPGCYQELGEIIRDARISALNAQLRTNIAGLVVQALRKQGFALEGCSDASVDQHQEYLAHLVNPRGSEVIVHVSSTGPALGENELRLESLDRSQRSEHELRQRWQEIDRALRRCGLEVSASLSA